MENLEERFLIEQLQNGNPKAWEKFYESFFDKIYKYAFRRIKNRESVEDVVEETFLRVIKNIKSFEYNGIPLDVWVYKVERNIINDFFRKEISRGSFPLEDLFIEKFKPILDDPYSMQEAEEIKVYINKLIEKLPDKKKEVIKMRFLECRSIKECAVFLNESEENIKVLQYRALKDLKKMVEQNQNE